MGSWNFERDWRGDKKLENRRNKLIKYGENAFNAGIIS